MESSKAITTKHALYASVPVVLALLYWKFDVFVKLRQRWLVKWVNHNHSKRHKGHYHHSHGESTDAHTVKEKLFHGLNNLTNSSVSDLKGKDLGIRILEIGVGPGTNFQYFPRKCQLVAVDPNPYFEEMVKANLEKFPGVKLERRLLCGAEDMTEIDYASVDAVVATLVFCQVKDVLSVFNEIKRILVPGGKFYYLDHVPSEKGTLRRFYQEFLTKTGIAGLVFNGNLIRDIGRDISKAGFAEVNQSYTDFTGTRVVLGVATK